MPKIVMMDLQQLMDSSINDRADAMFQNMLDIVERHGSCYFRFTLEDGIVIVKPEYNAKITVVIADA